jgi:hypothetical protein
MVGTQLPPMRAKPPLFATNRIGAIAYRPPARFTCSLGTEILSRDLKKTILFKMLDRAASVGATSRLPSRQKERQGYDDAGYAGAG